MSETIETTEHTVKCNGGDGALGHPAIYLEFGEKNEIMCPYCSRKFIHTSKKSAKK